MTFDPQYTMPAAMNDARIAAGDLYRNQAWKARMRRFWAFITRTSGHLQELCCGQGGRREGSYVGMREIAIDTICGSEERADDFDNFFRPLASHDRDRWLSVAEARLPRRAHAAGPAYRSGRPLLRARRPPSHLGGKGAGRVIRRRRGRPLADAVDVIDAVDVPGTFKRPRHLCVPGPFAKYPKSLP